MSAESMLFAPPPPAPDVEPDMRVGFILSPRFSLMPFAAFVDCLRHAADEADYSRQVRCRWTVLAPTTEPIVSSGGVAVCPHEMLSKEIALDHLVVVGGVLPESLEHPEETLAYLRMARERRATLVGLCTGSFVLAQAGLLDGRRCALHFEHVNQFKQMFPRALPEADRIFVRDGEVITCPGGTSAFDVALELIERCCGRARANKVVPSLFVERHRAAQHMPRRPYGDLKVCGNRHVEQAVSLIEQNLSRPYTVRELVQRLNTSERVLYRAFREHAGDTPGGVSRRVRLAHGHWLLANTKRTVTQVAGECGFADAAHFCRLFRSTYGETPTGFRERAESGGAAVRG